MKINKKAWDAFGDYDISDILRAVDYWDTFCDKLGDTDEIRKNLQLLDKRAEELQNKGTRTIPEGDEPLGDLATEIEFAIDSLIEELEKIRDIVSPLSNLFPDEDEDDSEESE
jgi:hypothetical protein